MFEIVDEELGARIPKESILSENCLECCRRPVASQLSVMNNKDAISNGYPHEYRVRHARLSTLSNSLLSQQNISLRIHVVHMPFRKYPWLHCSLVMTW